MSNSSFGYKRNFIILDEQDDLHRSNQSKNLTGYVKIEDRGIKTKITLYIQNIIKGRYRVMCIFTKGPDTKAVDIDELEVDNTSKAEQITETVSDNIFNKGFSTDDVIGIAIFSYENKKIAEGFKEGAKQDNYEIEVQNKQTVVVSETIPNIEEVEQSKVEQVEDKIQDKLEDNIEPEAEPLAEVQDKDKKEEITKPKCACEEKEKFKTDLDLAPIQDLNPIFNEKFKSFKVKPVSSEINEKREGEEDRYIPFDFANPHINWGKENTPLRRNRFSQRLLMNPYLLRMIYQYNHYIIGITDEYIVIGIPAKHSCTVNYMDFYIGRCLWVNASSKIEDYGYWLFLVNPRDGEIIKI